jgi:GrpB-like predicted nucleotidyltransferase (UPF0157 family)
MLIQEYNRQWPADFQRIKTILSDALTGIPVTIEHVGSTAVPGLAAKPIIDIDVVLADRNDFESIKERLAQIGYYHNGDQGIADREVFKRSTSEYEEVLDAIAHHLYVCSIDSEELKRHLLFRDYLHTHAAARNEYQQLKQQLAEEANNDRKRYAQLKEEKAKAFIEGILAKANK